MGKVYIDYNKLMSSASNITSSIGESENINGILEDIRSELDAYSRQHDNCLPTSTGDIEVKIAEISKSLRSLVNGLEQSVNIFSAAELSVISSIDILSTGLDNVLKMKLNKSYDKSLEGYDYEKYQEKLEKTLNTTNGTRAKSVAAALFLATSFPHMNYFWGGGHDKIQTGLDPSWGSPKTVTAGGSETTGTEQPNSLDCSGYVSWSLKNGGYQIEKPMVTGELEKLGQKVSITDPSASSSQVGDLAYMDGHVGMIISKQNNNITVSHCSGSGGGMNITTIDTATGLVVGDATNQERIGNPYFTDIIKMEYKD